MNEEQTQPERAEEYCKLLQENGLEYFATFVPWSQSRNAEDKSPSLNWRVTLKQGAHTFTTDYMQGVAHIPHYNFAHSRLVVYDDAVRKACETGRSRIGSHKNGYDATRFMARKLPAPKLVDVLFALVMDSDALEYLCFEDWAEMLGYDTDSRAAEKVYRVCLDTALQLRQMIDLDNARDAFEGY